MKKILLVFFSTVIVLFAQENKSGQSRFLVRGYAHSGLELTSDESSFVGGSFNPIFLWQQSDRLLFEAELEMEFEGHATAVALEYADMSYILNNYAILRLGKFLLPFGTFAERLHPAWINRSPSKPLGFGHDGVGPAADYGIELRGAGFIGSGKVNYSLYVVNGPRLNQGDDPSLDQEEAGMLVYGNAEDNNKNKAVGGRLGILPFSNSSLEIGISGQYAVVGDNESDYKDIAAVLYSGDITYLTKIDFLKGVVDIKGQLNQVNVDRATYINMEDSSSYTFKNESQAYYAQLTYRPAYVDNAFFKNIEFVGRYSSLKAPEGALWENDQKQYTIGLNYWLDWRSVIKASYNIADNAAGHGHEEEGSSNANSFMLHWAFGF